MSRLSSRSPGRYHPEDGIGSESVHPFEVLLSDLSGFVESYEGGRSTSPFSNMLSVPLFYLDAICRESKQTRRQGVIGETISPNSTLLSKSIRTTFDDDMKEWGNNNSVRYGALVADVIRDTYTGSLLEIVYNSCYLPAVPFTSLQESGLLPVLRPQTDQIGVDGFTSANRGRHLGRLVNLKVHVCAL